MTRRVVAVGPDRRLLRQWVDVPGTLYAGHGEYVPPLRAEARAGADPRRNPFFRHAEIEHFLLLDGDRPTGRISATVHPAYNERQAEPVGFFGFLDAPEDADAVALLLRAVERWTAERGLHRVAGPFNYWSGQEMGLLTSGHDERPAVFHTWNPKSYPDLVEAAGYTPRTRLDAYRLDGDDLLRLRATLTGVAERVRRDQGLTTRPLRMRRFDADMETARRLFNASFATSPDVVPYERDVFTAMVRPLKPLVDPRLVRFVERDGEAVAFSVIVPDVNEILARLDGRLRPLDLLRLPRWKAAIDTVVVLLVGSLPGVPMGAAHLLFADSLLSALDSGYRSVRTSWVHERNHVLHGLMRGFGATLHKQWALYEREVTA